MLISNANKKLHQIVASLLVWFGLTAFMLAQAPSAHAWPVNHLDSSTVGNKPDCIACHYQYSGLLNVETIRGVANTTNSVTVAPGNYFDVTFRTQGLGYGRYNVAGAVKVPTTSKWTAAAVPPGNDTPWITAQQTTINGAPVDNPSMLVTGFSSSANPSGQRGVTLDNGSTTGYVDRNSIANNEAFSVRIQVDASVTPGSYQIKLWGVGTTSNGALGYNERVVTVHVNNDSTAPTVPGAPSTTAISPQRIDLSWTGSTDGGSGMEGYWVYRKASTEADYKRIAFTTTTNYSAIDLRADVSYSFKIAAVDKAGNLSAQSGAGIRLTPSGARNDSNPPAQPEVLWALIVGDPPGSKTNKVVQLLWEANLEADVDGYNILRSTSANAGFVQINEGLVNDTSYEDIKVKEGTTYYYKIEAIDVAGNKSNLSSYILATPAVDEGLVDPHGRYTNKEGTCFTCHSTHTGQGPALMSRGGITDVCYSCHDGSQSKFNTKADFNTEVNPSHHKIPEGRYGCDECHNPHLSSSGATNSVPKLLETRSLEDLEWKNGGNEFCWACHGVGSELPNPFGRDHQTEYLTSKHSAGLPDPSSGTKIQCSNCHKSHGSRDYPLLVSSNSAYFCVNCHNDMSPQGGDGLAITKILLDNNNQDGSKTMWNMSQFYNGTTHEKRFYGRNTCTMCHEPHGSSNRYMLRDPYYDKRANYDWATNWESTTDGSGKVIPGGENTLCFRCHDPQFYVGVNANGKPTLGSRFGSGNAKNYHTHVTNRDISCRYCHDPHSGKHNSQNTTRTPKWNLDNSHYVNFEWAYQSGLVSPSGTAPNNRLAFIPIYATDGKTEIGFSCALSCHSLNHTDSKSSTGFKSYGRKSSSPALKCAACHDHDSFDTNSSHPVLTGTGSSYLMSCEMCHIEDHTKHTGSNPWGLKDTILTTWDNKTTKLRDTTNPSTGQTVPAYGEYCWQCHGTVTNADPTLNTRDILGDKYTQFVNKPHSQLQRDGKSNPYGQGMDMSCLSCHDHHASRNVSLIKSNIDGTAIDAAVDVGKINACMACHDGSPAPINIAAKYNAANSAGHFIKADPTKKLLCTECHDSHGTTNLYYLLDSTNKYGTGVSFPKDRDNNTNPFKDREFCLACHPGSDQSAKPYDTTNTLKMGIIMLAPLPASIAAHDSTSGDSCVQCHDPHKPWPATGSNDKCYSCHSPQGEASDTYSKMGLTSEVGSGLPSKHRITDGDTTNNTCMLKCHTGHPHSPRSNSLKLPGGLVVDEKSKCLSCHDTSAPQAPRTIDKSLYEGTTHDYDKVRTTYSDNSEFKGNCTKCHTPHGSLFSPLLAKPKDELCVSCHDGVTKDQSGNKISDIKTIYTKAGHAYKDFPGSKMYCDECHLPHGSTNVIFLRDRNGTGQNIKNQDGTPRNFPTGLGTDYNTRDFCTVCHLEYTGSAQVVKYTSQTAPGGTVEIKEIPLNGPNGVYVPEHQLGQTKACSDCHNPHDPEPVGSNKDCFICHGYEGTGGKAGYALNIQDLTGYRTQPAPTGIMSRHPIEDAMTPNNDCMQACHLPHTHNPRANLLTDYRAFSSDTVAPTPPTGASAVASSGNQIDVKFTGSASSNIFGYNIYKDNVKYGVFNNNIPSAPSLVFQDGGVKGSASYSISAFNKGGYESAKVNLGTVGTNKSADIIAPAVPEKLTATAKNSTRVTLSWLRTTDNYGVKGYNIYRSNTYTSGYTLVGTTGINSFSEGGLQEKATYYYRVSALDYQGNESGQSLVASVTLPSVVGQTAIGLYSEGTESVELVNANNTRTNFFHTSDSFKVRLSSTSSAFSSIQGSQIVLKEYHSRQVAGPYTSYVQTNSSGMNTYEWSVATPDTDGLYQMELQVTDRNGQQFKMTESITIGATTERMKTYSDSSYTKEKETSTFKPGDRVYVESVSSVPINGYDTRAGYLYNYRNNMISTQGISPNYNSGYIRYSFQLPSSGLQDGWWYTIGHYVTSAEKKKPVVSNNFKQIKIKVQDTTPPSQPATVGFVNIGSSSLTVTWSESSSSDVAGYNIYRSTDGTNYTLVGSTENVSFIDTGLLDANLNGDIQYYYRVRAYDLAGNLSTNASASVRTAVAPVDNVAPSKPVGINVVGDGPARAKISWAAGPVSEGVVGYCIFRSSDGVNFYKVGVSSNTTYTDTGMQGGTVYYYQVAAHDISGNVSEHSVKVSVLVPPGSDDSVEAALCMSCHDGTGTRADWATLPAYMKSGPTISTAYLKSKHNVDIMINSFKDGSQYYGNCTKCHVPHGSAYPKLLVLPDDNDLCLRCHTPASASGRYSGKATFVESSHGSTASTSPSGTPRLWPGGDGTLARQPGSEGRCYNCHTPHARYVPSTTEVIKSSALAGDSKSLNKLCYGCHQASGYNNGTPIIYDWEWQGKVTYESTAHGDSNKNAKMKLDNTYGAGECANCHDPHGTKEPAMLSAPMNVENSRKNELCLRCHNKADILTDTGLFEGSEVYNLSQHGLKAQWIDELNYTDYDTSNPANYAFKNKTSFLPGVCANCHNSHGKQEGGTANPKMLVVKDTSGNEMCNRCHESPTIKSQTAYYKGKTLYDASAHKSSAKWPGGGYYNKPINDVGKCVNCHDPHGVAKVNESGNLEYIKGAVFDEEEKLCYVCHSAIKSYYDTWGSNSSYKGHAFWETKGVYSSTGDIRSAPRRVECLDCHDPHQAQKPAGTDTNLAQRVPKVLKGSWGVQVIGGNGSGNANWPNVAAGELKTPAATAYEIVQNPTEDWQICFKCHSSYTSHSGQVTMIQWVNPKNKSVHGFGNGGTNTAINNNKAALLNAPWSTMTNPKTRCLDCHGSAVAGSRGPHGSNLDYMLKVDPKTMNFCTMCHKATAYGVGGSSSASAGSSAHGQSQHYTQSKNTPPRTAFTANFGNNWCRGCHFAGQGPGRAEVPMSGYTASESSIHGTNVSYGDNGMNGFYLSNANTTPGNKSCTDAMCQTHGVKGY